MEDIVTGVTKEEIQDGCLLLKLPGNMGGFEFSRFDDARDLYITDVN